MQMMDLPDEVLIQQKEITDFYNDNAKKMDLLDTQASELEKLFYGEVENKTIFVENLEDEDIERHQELFEINELKQLEGQI